MLPGSNRTILEAFRQGNAAVLARVYRVYSPEVVHYLTRRFTVRSTPEVSSTSLEPLDLEAVHQETFMRAFQPDMRLAYDGVRPYLGFLLMLSRSTAIDMLRASGRISREAMPLEDAPEVEQLPVEERNPEERALESEVRTLVRRFLAELPGETREFARLRYVEGLSQERSALHLQLTRSEVRVRERRLRLQLLEHLRAWGWLETATSEPWRLADSLRFTALFALSGLVLLRGG